MEDGFMKKKKKKTVNPTVDAMNATRPRNSMGRPSVFCSKKDYSRGREKEKLRREVMSW